MPEVVVTKRFAAPQERVFEIMTDLENAPGRVSSILKLDVLTPGPVGMGTRFRETRKMFGKEATETMEFVEFSPPSSYAVAAESCGTRYLSTFTFTPVSDGATDVEVRFQWTPVSMPAKVLGVFGGLMKGMLRKFLEADLVELKKAAEATQPVS